MISYSLVAGLDVTTELFSVLFFISLLHIYEILRLLWRPVSWPHTFWPLLRFYVGISVFGEVLSLLNYVELVPHWVAAFIIFLDLFLGLAVFDIPDKAAAAWKAFSKAVFVDSANSGTSLLEDWQRRKR